MDNFNIITHFSGLTRGRFLCVANYEQRVAVWWLERGKMYLISNAQKRISCQVFDGGIRVFETKKRRLGKKVE